MADWFASFDDPRITPQFCRHIPSSDGDRVLIGVVHNHPASVARVEQVVDVVDPEVLALELPPAAVSLYRAYAADGDGRPRFGGEMSAAIAAAPNAEVIGIDGPNWPFFRRLLATLVADRASPQTARRVLSSLSGATREALACRIAAPLTHATSMTVTRDDPLEYDCSAADSPAEQATHERTHVASVRALLKSVDTEGTAVAYRDDTREQCMIDRLEGHSDVVAVVGVDHLETLAAAVGN